MSMYGKPHVGVDASKDGMTKQSAKDECDINKIVAKANKQGFVESLNTREPMYIDTTVIPDYQSALNIVLQAQDAFDALPSDVREEFDNDPARMIKFLGDSKNDARAIELGLINKPEEVVIEEPKE